MNQIVIAIKKGKRFETEPNPLLPITKCDCVTKNFETQVEDRYHSEKDTHAVPSVTIKAKHVNNQNPVSYTHLTLPTIYSV